MHKQGIKWEGMSTLKPSNTLTNSVCIFSACSANCKAGHCDQVTGACSACNDGFWDKKCDKRKN